MKRLAALVVIAFAAYVCIGPLLSGCSKGPGDVLRVQSEYVTYKPPQDNWSNPWYDKWRDKFGLNIRPQTMTLDRGELHVNPQLTNRDGSEKYVPVCPKRWYWSWKDAGWIYGPWCWPIPGHD